MIVESECPADEIEVIVILDGSPSGDASVDGDFGVCVRSGEGMSESALIGVSEAPSARGGAQLQR